MIICIVASGHYNILAMYGVGCVRRVWLGMGMDMHMHTAYSACSKEDETWCAVQIN